MRAKTFRQIWGPLADLVCTSPARLVVWYEGAMRRLRLIYRANTGRMRLSLWRGASRWEKLESIRWPEMAPAMRAHRARAVLLAERDKRFSERPALVVTPLPGCRGRLRTVPAGGR